MNTTKRKYFGLMTAGLALGFGMTALTGCDDLASQCGLVCPDSGVLQGNASISGIASMDSFFGAVLDFQASANTVTVNIRGELDAIAIGVGLEPGAAGADIKAAIDTKINAAVSGGLKIQAKPAECKASLDVTASAAAECDVEVEPGSVEVQCEGSCAIDASVQADCAASGNLRCEGTAPNLACEGTCTGECNLEVAASCEGTCRGACDGECSVKDASGNCAGACDGMCQGSCELKAGGSCGGSCEGSCEWDPGMAMCDASVQAKCEAAAEANVECSGSCNGDVKPPEVSAECEATVEAKAEASVECTPPSVEIAWQWSAELDGDVQAQGEFKAWINTFKGQLGALVAATAKARILVDGVGNLSTAGMAAIEGAAADLKADGDLKASIGGACALLQLEGVGTILGEVGGDLSASLSASAEITAMAGV